jgi:hypothetical protein
VQAAGIVGALVFVDVTVLVTGVQAIGRISNVLVWGVVNDSNTIAWQPVSDENTVTWTAVST